MTSSSLIAEVAIGLSATAITTVHAPLARGVGEHQVVEAVGVRVADAVTANAFHQRGSVGTEVESPHGHVVRARLMDAAVTAGAVLVAVVLDTLPSTRIRVLVLFVFDQVFDGGFNRCRHRSPSFLLGCTWGLRSSRRWLQQG